MFIHYIIVFFLSCVDLILTNALSWHILHYSGPAPVKPCLGLVLSLSFLDPDSATYTFAQPSILILQSYPKSTLVQPALSLTLPHSHCLYPYHSVFPCRDKFSSQFQYTRIHSCNFQACPTRVRSFIIRVGPRWVTMRLDLILIIWHVMIYFVAQLLQDRIRQQASYFK